MFYAYCKHNTTLKLENRNSHKRCSIEIAVLKNFTKLIGKHLCQGLFFNKVAGLGLDLYLQTTASVEDS